MLTFTLNLRTLGIAVLIIVAAVAAVLFFRWLWFSLRKLLFKPELHGLGRSGIKASWDEIERLLGGPGEMSLKMAVLEADKLLDHVLKSMAMPGNTLGERLKFAAYKYPKIRKVWWAHKLRNQLVHESSFYLDPRMARRAVQTFKSTLKLLNVL